MIGIDIAETLDRAQQDALTTAVVVLTDEVLDDLEAVSRGLHASETLTAANLPPAYRGRYDDAFLRKFSCCLQLVAWKLFSPSNEHLACLAEELALYVILHRAQGVLEVQGIDADFSVIESCAFEDMDFEWLYDPSTDGIEDSVAARALGMANLNFSDWFKPFRADELVHPYVAF